MTCLDVWPLPLDATPSQKRDAAVRHLGSLPQCATWAAYRSTPPGQPTAVRHLGSLPQCATWAAYSSALPGSGPTARWREASPLECPDLRRALRHHAGRHVQPVAGGSAATGFIFSFLETVFCREGVPWELVSDSDPAFRSAQLAEFLSRMGGVRQTFSSPYSPQSCGWWSG